MLAASSPSFLKPEKASCSDGKWVSIFREHDQVDWFPPSPANLPAFADFNVVAILPPQEGHDYNAQYPQENSMRPEKPAFVRNIRHSVSVQVSARVVVRQSIF